MDYKLLRRLFRAFGNTMVLFGSVHIVLLFTRALVSGNWRLMNIFVILDLHELFPQVLEPVYLIFSYLIFAAICLFFLRSGNNK